METEKQTSQKPAEAASRRTFDAVKLAKAAEPHISKDLLEARLKKARVEPTGDVPDDLVALLRAEGANTQGHVAGVLISLGWAEQSPKTLNGEKLTEVLTAGFSAANVGKRHGPHYLSHARRGNLKGLEGKLMIPFERRKAAEKPADEKGDGAQAGASTDDSTKGLSVIDPKDIAKMDRPQLQAALEARQLKSGGKTADLRNRLKKAVEEPTTEA